MVLCNWGIIPYFTSISDLIVKRLCNHDSFTVLRIRSEVMEKPCHWMIENIFECPYNPFETFFTVQH